MHRPVRAQEPPDRLDSSSATVPPGITPFQELTLLLLLLMRCLCVPRAGFSATFLARAGAARTCIHSLETGRLGLLFLVHTRAKLTQPGTTAQQCYCCTPSEVFGLSAHEYRYDTFKNPLPQTRPWCRIRTIQKKRNVPYTAVFLYRVWFVPSEKQQLHSRPVSGLCMQALAAPHALTSPKIRRRRQNNTNLLPHQYW